MNATANQITQLQAEPYVLKVESFVKNNPSGKTVKKEKFPKNLSSKISFNYGNSLAQIEQVNLRTLHVQGFTGARVSIAVIDTGFPTVNTGSAFARMRSNNQIKHVYNFISKNTDVYNTSLNSHGTNCLGIIGGYLDGTFVGAAPDADFYLYATEDGTKEIPEEELYWIQAAEEADRKGVDIISTSLGYGDFFDDARYNYSYSQMNGTTSFIARGAQIASEKGIIVVVAAGNEGNLTWKYIVTPADNEKVFTIGGVDSTGNPSIFTSFGPNSTGKVKPDASARGTSTYFAYNNGAYPGNGTSYATPLSAGGIACLLQAIPNSTNRELLKNSLRQTASLSSNPNDRLGYGILNFSNALTAINTTMGVENIKKSTINIYPNPVKSILNIKTDDKIKAIELYDEIGRKVKNLSKSNVINLENLSKGIYYLKIQSEKSSSVAKIIKE